MTKSGLYLNPMSREVDRWGFVRAIGTGKTIKSGGRVKPDVKLGDLVLVDISERHPVMVGGELMHLTDADKLMCIWEIEKHK
jgi:co-chaperonin GroES (HSP10)